MENSTPRWSYLSGGYTTTLQMSASFVLFEILKGGKDVAAIPVSVKRGRVQTRCQRSRCWKSGGIAKSGGVPRPLDIGCLDLCIVYATIVDPRMRYGLAVIAC